MAIIHVPHLFFISSFFFIILIDLMTKIRSLYLDHFTLRKTHLYEFIIETGRKPKVADLCYVGNKNELYTFRLLSKAILFSA